MLKTDDDRVILLVEGENDVAVLAGHIDDSACNLLPGYGSSVVIGAMKIVEEEVLDGVLALVDQDWRGLLTPLPASANIFFTDQPDLDATIFHMSGPLDRVVANFSDTRKRIAHLQRIDADSPWEIAVRLALPIGVLRYISERDGMELKLRDFPVESALALDSASIDVRRMCEVAISRSRSTSVYVPGDVAQMVEQLLSDLEHERVRYCSGHDLARCLSAVMRKRWGGCYRGDIIERSLRAALSCGELAGTRFYGQILAWANSHGSRIWCCDLAALN